MKYRICFILVFLFFGSSTAQAWWNEDWTFRKKIHLDTSDTAANINESLTDFPVLVRLHTGNFSYFMDIQESGADLRFVASDDKTPLKYHIETFDLVNQMAYIWVKLPRLTVDTNKNYIWMYYGNPNTKGTSDAQGTYGNDTIAVYHFNDADGIPSDKTGYKNNADKSTVDINSVSLISTGVKLNGNHYFSTINNPSLRINPALGFSFSAWLRISEPQKITYLFQQQSGKQSLSLLVDDDALFARIQHTSEKKEQTIESPKTSSIALNKWHHVALILKNKEIELFINGELSSSLQADIPELQGPFTFGASSKLKQHFIGELDEVNLFKTATRRLDKSQRG